MPVLLIAIGIVLFASGVRGTVSQLAAQLRTDFTGANSFLYWCVACLFIGALGAVGGKWRTASRAFLALTVIAFVLANRGIIANVQSTLAAPPTPSPADKQPASAVSAGGSAGTAGSSNGAAQVPGMAQGGSPGRTAGNASAGVSSQNYAAQNGLTDVNSVAPGTFDTSNVFGQADAGSATQGFDAATLLSGFGDGAGTGLMSGVA